MERIGIAASKIAKGNLFLYNFFVILISFLFSLLIFFIAGLSVILGLLVISQVVNGIIQTDLEKGWRSVMGISLMSLAVIVGFFNLFAILKNIKISRGK